MVRRQPYSDLKGWADKSRSQLVRAIDYFNRNQLAPAQKQSRNRTNASLDVCMRWTTINTDLIGETGAEDSTHSHRVMRSTYVLLTTSVYFYKE
jgi:hypothetical protein